MNRRLLWKLCLTITMGTVALFYVINVLTSRTEEGMSFLAKEDRKQLINWGRKAEKLYLSGDYKALRQWLDTLQKQESTWASVVTSELTSIAGNSLNERFHEGFWLGRSVDWKIHLYFQENPIMEVTFNKGGINNHVKNKNIHFLILLPQRMRPGIYWGYTSVALQIILPMILLTLLSIILYRHIMTPLQKMKVATKDFSQGKFDVRVRQLLGNRSDELTELANTFDQMATRIGELIINQRQLISDLSHELRTPLTRLDVALENLNSSGHMQPKHSERIRRESQHIRKLVDDALTLAWLENERPNLHGETLDLVDLLDVLVEDAQFEFADRILSSQLPNTAPLYNSNHRAVGQALENIIRNALRHTPAGKEVKVVLQSSSSHHTITIDDQGPGVAKEYLKSIFRPFFKINTTLNDSSDSFGLGLALAQRQLAAVGGHVKPENLTKGGLRMTVTLPSSY